MGISKTDKILNATIKLFLRDGYKKTTMDDIAENANASKVTIYKYFADKDALYYEIGRHIFSGYTVQLERIIVADMSLIKKLYTFLDSVCDFTDSGKFDLCAELVKYNDALEPEQKLYLHTYRQCLLKLIDEGIKNGLIKRNLDRDMLFHYINMGLVYYQQDVEYRALMRGESNFRQRFMQFCVGNIFADQAQAHPAL